MMSSTQHTPTAATTRSRKRIHTTLNWSFSAPPRDAHQCSATMTASQRTPSDRILPITRHKVRKSAPLMVPPDSLKLGIPPPLPISLPKQTQSNAPNHPPMKTGLSYDISKRMNVPDSSSNEPKKTTNKTKPYDEIAVQEYMRQQRAKLKSFNLLETIKDLGKPLHHVPSPPPSSTRSVPDDKRRELIQYIAKKKAMERSEKNRIRIANEAKLNARKEQLHRLDQYRRRQLEEAAKIATPSATLSLRQTTVPTTLHSINESVNKSNNDHRANLENTQNLSGPPIISIVPKLTSPVPVPVDFSSNFVTTEPTPDGHVNDSKRQIHKPMSPQKSPPSSRLQHDLQSILDDDMALFNSTPCTDSTIRALDGTSARASSEIMPVVESPGLASLSLRATGGDDNSFVGRVMHMSQDSCLNRFQHSSSRSVSFELVSDPTSTRSADLNVLPAKKERFRTSVRVGTGIKPVAGVRDDAVETKRKQVLARTNRARLPIPVIEPDLFSPLNVYVRNHIHNPLVPDFDIQCKPVMSEPQTPLSKSSRYMVPPESTNSGSEQKSSKRTDFSDTNSTASKLPYQSNKDYIAGIPILPPCELSLISVDSLDVEIGEKENVWTPPQQGLNDTRMPVNELIKVHDRAKHDQESLHLASVLLESIAALGASALRYHSPVSQCSESSSLVDEVVPPRHIQTAEKSVNCNIMNDSSHLNHSATISELEEVEHVPSSTCTEALKSNPTTFRNRSISSQTHGPDVHVPMLRSTGTQSVIGPPSSTNLVHANRPITVNLGTQTMVSCIHTTDLHSAAVPPKNETNASSSSLNKILDSIATMFTENQSLVRDLVLNQFTDQIRQLESRVSVLQAENNAQRDRGVLSYQAVPSVTQNQPQVILIPSSFIPNADKTSRTARKAKSKERHEHRLDTYSVPYSRDVFEAAMKSKYGDLTVKVPDTKHNRSPNLDDVQPLALHEWGVHSQLGKSPKPAVALEVIDLQTPSTPETLEEAEKADLSDSFVPTDSLIAAMGDLYPLLSGGERTPAVKLVHRPDPSVAEKEMLDNLALAQLNNPSDATGVSTGHQSNEDPYMPKIEHESTPILHQTFPHLQGSDIGLSTHSGSMSAISTIKSSNGLSSGLTGNDHPTGQQTSPVLSDLSICTSMSSRKESVSMSSGQRHSNSHESSVAELINSSVSEVMMHGNDIGSFRTSSALKRVDPSPASSLILLTSETHSREGSVAKHSNSSISEVMTQNNEIHSSHASSEINSVSASVALSQILDPSRANSREVSVADHSNSSISEVMTQNNEAHLPRASSGIKSVGASPALSQVLEPSQANLLGGSIVELSNSSISEVLMSSIEIESSTKHISVVTPLTRSQVSELSEPNSRVGSIAERSSLLISEATPRSTEIKVSSHSSSRQSLDTSAMQTPDLEPSRVQESSVAEQSSSSIPEALTRSNEIDSSLASLIKLNEVSHAMEPGQVMSQRGSNVEHSNSSISHAMTRSDEMATSHASSGIESSGTSPEQSQVLEPSPEHSREGYASKNSSLTTCQAAQSHVMELCRDQGGSVGKLSCSSISEPVTRSVETESASASIPDLGLHEGSEKDDKNLSESLVLSSLSRSANTSPHLSAADIAARDLKEESAPPDSHSRSRTPVLTGPARPIVTTQSPDAGFGDEVTNILETENTCLYESEGLTFRAGNSACAVGPETSVTDENTSEPASIPETISVDSSVEIEPLDELPSNNEPLHSEHDDLNAAGSSNVADVEDKYLMEFLETTSSVTDFNGLSSNESAGGEGMGGNQQEANDDSNVLSHVSFIGCESNDSPLNTHEHSNTNSSTEEIIRDSPYEQAITILSGSEGSGLYFHDSIHSSKSEGIGDEVSKNHVQIYDASAPKSTIQSPQVSMSDLFLPTESPGEVGSETSTDPVSDILESEAQSNAMAENDCLLEKSKSSLVLEVAVNDVDRLSSNSNIDQVMPAVDRNQSKSLVPQDVTEFVDPSTKPDNPKSTSVDRNELSPNLADQTAEQLLNDLIEEMSVDVSAIEQFQANEPQNANTPGSFFTVEYAERYLHYLLIHHHDEISMTTRIEARCHPVYRNQEANMILADVAVEFRDAYLGRMVGIGGMKEPRIPSFHFFHELMRSIQRDVAVSSSPPREHDVLPWIIHELQQERKRPCIPKSLEQFRTEKLDLAVTELLDQLIDESANMAMVQHPLPEGE